MDLLAIEDGVVRLRFEGGCGCSSTAGAMRSAIEDTITARAPDVIAVKIEGLDAGAGSESRFSLPVL